VSGLPDVFRDYLDGLEEQRLSIRAGDTFHQCFGCGPAHQSGLRVRCFRTPEGVISPIVIASEYAGPPGAAHGGIVAAYLDEVLAGAAARATGKICVTGELSVRYVEPVPVERPLLGRAALVADHGRYLELEGRLAELGTDRVLATARGRFFPIPSR